MMEQNAASRHLGLRVKMIISIILPAFICFSALNYYIVSNLTKALGDSPEAAKIVLTDIIIFIASFMVLIIAVLIMTNGIVKPVKQLIGYSESLAAGNTNFKIETVSRKDEIGQLARAIRSAQLSLKKVTMILDRASADILTGNLSVRADANYYPGDFGRIMENNNKIDDSICDVIRSIRDTGENVAEAAQQISRGSQALAQGSTEQAASVEELSATVSEILSRTRINSDNAFRTQQLSEQVREEAHSGSGKMNQLVLALEDISTSSSYISNVIKVIEDIAFQTNILALNAAVEAARAGAHGKGFAIVAAEVKSLAEKSAKAAQETNSLLSDNIKKSRDGLSIGEDMAKSLDSIISGIVHSVDSISEIADDCMCQVDIIEQLNTGLAQVSQVVQSNTATAQEAAASSEEMSAQSAMLMEMVAHYRIDVERIVAKPSGFKEEDY
jgi:methyl-accepting chemotaxis protein